MFKLPGVKPGSDLEAMFLAVGFVVVQWGQAEQSLDLIVSALSYGYPDKKARRLPVMLETKIKFLRERLPAAPELACVSTEFESLMSEFESLASVRNDLVHGAIANVSPTSNGFTFIKFDSDGRHNKARPVLLSGNEFPSLRKRLLHLVGEANRLAKVVWDLRPDAK